MDDNRQGQTPSSVEIGAEIREYMSLQGQRRRLFPRAMLVGLLAGGAAVLFRWALEYGDALRDRFLVWVHQYPTWGWLLPMVGGALGAGGAVPWYASSLRKPPGAVSRTSKRSSHGCALCGGTLCCP